VIFDIYLYIENLGMVLKKRGFYKVKKLLYLSFVDFKDANHLGVIKKISTHIKVFNNAKLDTTCITIEGNRIIRIVGENKVCLSDNCGQGIRARIALLNAVKEFLKNNPVDICYIRYQFSCPFFKSVLRQLKSVGAKVVVEMATFPYEPELRKQGLIGFLKIGCDRMFRGYMGKSVDKFVTYTDDEHIFGVESIQVINGLDPDITPLRKPRKPDGRTVLLTVSSMKPWHGYERLLKGIRNYYKNGGEEEILLYMVGEGPSCTEYRDLVNEYNLTDKVVFCGVLKGKVLNDIYNSSDIAIGSLALHRVGISVASPLKTAEYAIRGIPFVTTSKVKDMKQDKYYMCVSASEEAIDLREVVGFYKKITTSGTSSQKLADDIHNCALKLYGMEKTHMKVIDYMNS
jgi:glycosyltransferase involved in cell wall biosynthesis